LLFPRAKITDPKGIYQWILNTFAQVSNWHFLCHLFKIVFLHTVHGLSADAVTVQLHSVWTVISAFSLFCDSSDIIFCYLSFFLLHSTWPVSHPSSTFVCWDFYDCLAYTDFFHFV